MWDNRGMDDHTRSNYSNWGFQILMVVASGVMGRIAGGFWWGVGVGILVGTLLVLRGLYPNTFTIMRIAIGLAVVLVAGSLVGAGWYLGHKGPPQATKTEPAPIPPTPAPDPAVAPVKKQADSSSDPSQSTNKSAPQGAKRGKVAPANRPVQRAAGSDIPPVTVTTGDCSATQIGGQNNEAKGGNCAPAPAKAGR
jgi:hypothetical protein